MRKAVQGNGMTPVEPLERTIERFSDEMKVRGYAPRTIGCYAFDIGHFTLWLRAKGVASFRDVTSRHVRDYETALATRPGRGGRPLTAATRAHVLAAP